MSLINRMLGELASRQAPGTDSLEGVHLTRPIAAKPGVTPRQAGLAVGCAVLAVGIAVWWRWPRETSVPTPRGIQALMDESLPAATSPPTLASGLSVAAPATWKLRLDPHFMAPQTPAERARAATESAIAADDDSGAARSGPTETSPASGRRRATAGAAADGGDALAPRRRREASLELDLASSLRDAPAPRAATAPAPAPAVAAPGDRSDPSSVTVTASNRVPIDDADQRKRQARAWLAKNQPALALEVLGEPEQGWDSERQSLRAAALQRAGRHEEAAAAYRTLAVSPRGDAVHFVGMAISLEALQRRDDARAAYRRALTFPELSPALRTYAETRLAALGDAG